MFLNPTACSEASSHSLRARIQVSGKESRRTLFDYSRLGQAGITVRETQRRHTQSRPFELRPRFTVARFEIKHIAPRRHRQDRLGMARIPACQLAPWFGPVWREGNGAAEFALGQNIRAGDQGAGSH